MTYLEKNGLATNCRILDYFYRPLQVLPNRTHPHMSMEATGGYMLHGYTVDYFVQEPVEVVETTQDADAPKKPQVKSLLHPLYRNTNDAFQYEPLLSASQDNENNNDNNNNNNNNNNGQKKEPTNNKQLCICLLPI
eukprot:UN03101